MFCTAHLAKSSRIRWLFVINKWSSKIYVEYGQVTIKETFINHSYEEDKTRKRQIMSNVVKRKSLKDFTEKL